MPLPSKIPVKITSEAAGYISFTPVARQELEPGELVERILSVTGKRVSRIREIISRGSFLSGNSRYRWEPLDTDSGELEALLERFPDADPQRPFDPAKCTRVVFQGRRGRLELASETGSQRRLFRRTSFWEVLLPALESAAPQYQHYSYADQADVYSVRLALDTLRALLDHIHLLKYRGIGQELSVIEPEVVELFVKR